MNPSKKKSEKRRQPIPIWTFAQAKVVAPYLRSVMTSLREHRLEMLRLDLLLKRQAEKPGRPNRADLIGQQEMTRAAHEASARYHDALDELRVLGVHCHEAIAGQALLPFVHERMLAWYVFNLFEADPLRFWRYHGDTETTLRPVMELR